MRVENVLRTIRKIKTLEKLNTFIEKVKKYFPLDEYRKEISDSWADISENALYDTYPNAEVSLIYSYAQEQYNELK